MGRNTEHIRVGAAVLAATLLSAACADDSPRSLGATATTTGNSPPTSIESTADDRPDLGTGGGGGRFARALEPFDDCTAFLDHVKAEAAARVGPYGLGQNGGWMVEEMAFEEPAAEEPASADVAEQPASEPAPTAGAPSDDGDSAYTDTNVQEVGVDEPDIIKTDGDRILVVRDDRLIHVDISTGTPRITDEIVVPGGWVQELFFLDGRAVLFTNGGTYGYPMPVDVEASVEPSGWEPPAAVLVEVDITDPADLRVTATLHLEGQYLSARRIDSKVRLAVSTGPQQLPWVFPQGPAGEERAEQTNRELIEESVITDWVPEYRLDANGAETTGSIVPCDRMNHPVDFAGFDVVSLVEIDLASGLSAGFTPAASTGVLAGGQTVYSSLDRFYVATTKWVEPDLARSDLMPPEWSDDYETDLHAFSIASDRPADYVASGSVPGTLLNQFSLDEHDGFVRAITTEGAPWDGQGSSETVLTVLEEQADRLVAVGSVGGLGKGESLYSARLLDDVGFAVTFRQIDPFYVLDLRDPRNPQMTGELKIPGFSTYLHPLGDNRVVGVGQDATEEGQVLGLKVSVFDVSDPAAPRETAVWTMPNATSTAEHDHRAFQMWGTTAILPVDNHNDGSSGVVLLDLSDGIREVGRVSPAPLTEPPTGDCRQITPDDALPADSDLASIVLDSNTHVQLCGPEDRGGWGGNWCDSFGLESWWSPDPAALDAALERLGATDDSRIEICYRNGVFGTPVERSLVADGVLYTLTSDTLQANRFDDLSLIAAVRVR